ncbi:MAG: S4 domain-containing protein YaaA [Erysipelotrichaceae bacterium]|nr:S4 domain-containing protein YaaA [Erysipelotrichaceae bacterium]MDY6141372.1 S4 domain-containing protein YaaA [Bacilli bacterium]
MEEILINTPYVTLGQFLKLADIIQSGGEAKLYLANNKVLINDEEDNRRGRKLKDGDIIKIKEKTYRIINENI